MSNLVEHARREMTLAGHDQDEIDSAIEVIQAFADMGHSGSSAAFCIPMFNELFQFKNLTPLTNRTEEWNPVEGFDANVVTWQNSRNSAAFSDDGGDSYWLVDDPVVDGKRTKYPTVNVYSKGSVADDVDEDATDEDTMEAGVPDMVNHPPHYNSHPSGVECITVTRWFNFNLGNVIKYIWRAGIKDEEATLEDLKKARWYLDNEIDRREGNE